MYKGRWLQISASDLGGTNRTDTTVAANQWFDQERAKIDRETVAPAYRPHELEYLGIRDNIRTEMKTLLTVLRANPAVHSVIVPILETLKQRDIRITRILHNPILPPPDDTVRNPLHISPDRVEREAVAEVQQQIADRLRGQTQSPFDYLYLRSLPDDDEQDTASYVTPALAHPTLTITDGDGEKSIYDERVQAVAETVAGLTSGVVARKKQELGLIESEYERGLVNQMLQEQGVTLPESRKLDYHIGKFIEARTQDCRLGGITPGRLKKIISTIDIYKKWSPIISGIVDRIGMKEHIEAYYSFLVQRVLAGEIKPKYAHNLFGDFKMLVFWLVNEEVLHEHPRCLQLKSNKYTFPVVRQKPKIATLETVYRILNAANPRLRLCILLTLNCGFGSAEIGRLTKDEYNPSTGRIYHKRYKTEKSDRVPIVCYKLWNETKELLDQELANRPNYPQRSESAEYLLINSNGTPLWSESIDKGKSDNITCAFKRLVTKLRKLDPEFPPITYYQFRRTSASLIFNEPKYKIFNGLWLGHAPQTVADESYNVVGDTILDECLDWLHGRIFGTELPSDS